MKKRRKRFESGGFSQSIRCFLPVPTPTLNFLLVKGRLSSFLLDLWTMADFSERADFISAPEQIGFAFWHTVKVFQHFFGFSFLGKTKQEISGTGRQMKSFLFKYLTD